MRLIRTLILVLFPIATLTATASAVPVGDAAFDAWTEELGAQAVRAKPELTAPVSHFATEQSQYSRRARRPIARPILWHPH